MAPAVRSRDGLLALGESGRGAGGSRGRAERSRAGRPDTYGLGGGIEIPKGILIPACHGGLELEGSLLAAVRERSSNFQWRSKIES